MPTLDTLAQLWDRVRTSLWFVPGLMALGALALAGLSPALDRAIPDEWLLGLPLVFSGQAGGARAVLTTIATSMITTAGVVFSMTIVSLQLASSQFGPRLLRTFLRDAGNQVVLGAFIGTFLYCILLLPTVDASADSSFVPRVSVSFAVLLAIACLGLLVYFIDHVAQSINADAVVHAVGAELDLVVDHLFPEPLGEAGELPEQPRPPHDGSTAIRADSSGYVRFVNGDVILRVASRCDAFVWLEAIPGQFVLPGDPVARVAPAESVGEDDVESIRRAVVVGAHRTTLQDILFAFEQLTEMAVRALSPGINDPTTAVHCVNRIAAGLARLVGRCRPARVREGEDGKPRLYAEVVALEEILAKSVDPIARNAAEHLPVWLRLLHAVDAAGARARRAADRDVLRQCARRLAEAARQACPDERDRSLLADAARGVEG